MGVEPSRKQDKNYEILYFDEWIKKYGCYEVYPEEEYRRILRESGILGEKEKSLLLDIGCGAGAFSARLSEHFRVVGLDISKEAIRIASGKGGSKFIIADMEYLPFKNNSFDLVFIGGALHHCPNLIASIAKELGGILKKQGKVYIFEPHALAPGNFYNFHFSTEPTKNEKALLPWKIKKIFQNNGFSSFQYKDIGEVTHIFPENYSGSLKLKRPVALKMLGILVLVCINILLKIPGLNKLFPGTFFVVSCARN